MYNNPYQSEKYKELYSIQEEQIPVLASLIEQSPKLGKQSVQNSWNDAVSSAVQSIADYNPYTPLVQEGAEVLAVDAVAWVQGSQNLDCRPRLFDGASKTWKLCDTGSMVSVVKRSQSDKIDPSKVLQAVNGSKIKCYGQKEVEIRLNRKTYTILATIADIEQDIIGWDFLSKYKFDFAWNEFGDLYLHDKKADIKAPLKFITYKSGSVPQTALLQDAEKVLSWSRRQSQIEEFEIASMKQLEPRAPESSKANKINPKYMRLIEKYPDILKPSFKELSTKHGVMHSIETTGPPVKCKPRPLLANSEKALKGKEAWDEMVRLGVVEKIEANANTDWASCLHLVPKPCGAMRPCSDFRQLNSRTVDNAYPLPKLKSFTHKLKGSKIFSKIDLFSAFHNVLINPKDVKKTTTLTPWGVFVYKRLAFGLSGAPGTFMKLIDSVLAGIDGLFCYLDDLLVHAKNEEEHYAILEQVFSRLQEAGLAIKLDKCEFGVKSVEYLGYEVSEHGIKPLKRKVQCIVDFQPPKSQKDLLHFLGALGYFRTSLKGIKNEKGIYENPAEIMQVLFNLATCKIPNKLKITDIWQQNKKIHQAFVKSKQMLIDAVMLTHPDPQAKLALCTDSSDFAVGGSLEQLGSDGTWKPLAFFSRHLGPDKQKWSTFRKELYACVQSLRHFLPDFYGRHITIYLDHLPLTKSFASNTLQSNDPVAQRQLVEIGMFTKDVRYLEAKNNHMADWLSRRTPEALIGEAYKNETFDKSNNFVKHENVDYKDIAETKLIENTAVESIKLSDILREQKSCKEIERLRKGLHPRSLTFDDVDINGQVLFCEVSGPKARPVVPEPLRDSILKLHHDIDHPGKSESVRRSAKEYFWTKMKTKIENYVKTCSTCQKVKTKKAKNPHIGDFPVPQKRFSHIHVDVCGPLPESKGYKYLLSVICRTTRFWDAIPMKEASSMACAEALLHAWVSKFGLASHCTSDNGSEFVSNLWKSMGDKLNIKLHYTNLYSPQTNGLVERQHSTLKTSLKAALLDMGEKYKDKWVDFLPWVLLMKRNAYQKELGTSPAILTFGTAPMVPGDVLRDPGDPLSEPQLQELVDFMQKSNNQEPKQTFKPNQEEVPEPPADVTHVYTRQHNTTGFDSPYQGPFKIISRPSRTTVVIKVGLTKSGEDRLECRHWRDLKIAHMRSDTPEAQRPKRGRPKSSPTKSSPSTTVDDSSEEVNSEVPSSDASDSAPTLSSKQTSSHSNSNSGGRTPRSTRNPNPIYVDGIVVNGPPPTQAFIWPDRKTRLWSPSQAEIAELNKSIGG